MEIRQLEYFVAVAEEANFTRAAERVNISQSGVSAQVRQLERELGAQLIDRGTRTAGLTAAGEAALEHARAALAAVEAVRQSVQDVTGLIRGRLSVGMVVGCTVTPLFDALAAFHAAHPGVTISLVEGSSDALVEQVHAGTVDLALVGTAGRTPDGLEAMTLVAEPLAALVPRGHPIAGQDRITLSDLLAYPLVCMPAGTGIRAVLDQTSAARGIRPVVALEASAADAIAGLVVRGLGVGVLTRSMAEVHHDRLSVVAVDGVELLGLLSLVWHGGRGGSGPALRALLERARAAFAADPAVISDGALAGESTAKPA